MAFSCFITTHYLAYWRDSSLGSPSRHPNLFTPAPCWSPLHLSLLSVPLPSTTVTCNTWERIAQPGLLGPEHQSLATTEINRYLMLSEAWTSVQHGPLRQEYRQTPQLKVLSQRTEGPRVLQQSFCIVRLKHQIQWHFHPSYPCESYAHFVQWLFKIHWLVKFGNTPSNWKQWSFIRNCWAILVDLYNDI